MKLNKLKPGQTKVNIKKFRKINLGCGYDKREDYLNVDVDAACEPDLLIENGDFSVIPDNHFNEILANDVLEHIPRSKSLQVLIDWSGYLKKNGILKLQTTSILSVAEQMKKNKKFSDHYGWSICLFGNQAHPGDFHYTGFTEATLKVHLLAAGYRIESFEIRDKWLFHVNAKKDYDLIESVKKNSNKSNSDFTDWVFKEAFGRRPDELGGVHILNELEAGRSTKLEVAKHLFSSPERLYHIAQQNNL